MIKRNLLLAGLFFGIFSVFILSAKAQEFVPMENQDESVDGQVMVYDPLSNKIDLNLYNVELKKQNENEMEILLDFTNDGYTISNLKYSVALIESTGEFSQIKRDEQISEEYFDLLEGEVLSKVINYKAPDYLNGKFELWIFVENDEGMNLSLSKVADVELKGNGQYVELVPDSCYVQVEGEDLKYGITNGVAIKENENLTVTCKIENHFNKSLETLLSIETHKRGLSGDIVDVQGVDSGLGLSLRAGESREFKFILPKAEEAQSYSAKISLNDENKNLVSNEIEVHYVISGATATIQSVSLDKNSYKEGEQGKLMVMISGPADNFPGSRLEKTAVSSLPVEISVFNNQGESCVEIADVLSSNYPFAEYEFESSVECYDPRIVIGVTDEKGNLLAEKETKINSQKKIQNNQKESSEKLKKENNPVFLIGIIVLASILALTSFVLLVKNSFFRKSKK